MQRAPRKSIITSEKLIDFILSFADSLALAMSSGAFHHPDGVFKIKRCGLTHRQPW